MTKWICKKCKECDPCSLDIGEAKKEPFICPLGCTTPTWNEIKEEPTTNSNQLPDWCKVGEWVYSIPAQKYDKIIAIQDYRIVTERMKYTDDYINDGNIVPARLRPYNAAEMKALVGKVLDRDGDRGLVTFYDGDINKVYLGAWFSADSIMEKYTIDGMPCGVLEHLTNYGEWKR